LCRINGFNVETQTLSKKLLSFYEKHNLLNQLTQSNETRKSIQIKDREIPVTISRDIEVKSVLETSNFNDWKQLYEGDTKIQLNSIDVSSVDDSFIKLNFKAQLDGKDLSGVSFVRGKSETFLPVLVNLTEPPTEYSVLIQNVRLAIGSHEFWEIPSGANAQNYLQEIGFEADEILETRIDMNQSYYGIDKQIYITPEASNESITFLYLKKEYDPKHFGKMKKEFEEKKSFKIVPLDELPWYSSDSKTFIALQMYKMLQQRGPPPPC